MEVHKLLETLHIAERLKDELRHCDTSKGRRESVAEHSWRIALMALFMQDEFPELDMNRVVQMCLIHDLGEAFTGDIPVFDKTAADEEREEQLLFSWVDTIPEPLHTDMRQLYREMEERATPEAKLYKALDGLEALISHNESDLATWEPNEYDLQMTYAEDRMRFSPYMVALREQIKQDSIQKIKNTGK